MIPSGPDSGPLCFRCRFFRGGSPYEGADVGRTLSAEWLDPESSDTVENQPGRACDGAHECCKPVSLSITSLRPATILKCNVF